MAEIVIHSISGPINMPDIDTFLFDLDGTLIDSLDLHIEAFQWILDKLGKDISKKELEPLMGKTPQDIIKKFFGNLTREELLHAATQKEDKLANIIESVYVYPHISTFLKQLKENNLKSIVISSTHRRLVKILLDKAELLQFLDDIVSGDEVNHGKPNPEPFAKGVIKANTKSNQTIAIGDSIHDFQSASAAGCNFVGILTGKTDEKTFLNAGCKILVNTISDFEIVKNL